MLVYLGFMHKSVTGRSEGGKEEKAVHADSIREVFYTFLNRFIMKNLYLILVLSALVACSGSPQRRSRHL